ncbi:AAA family ATPase [Clostridium sp. Ade.TY]|uniref:AAA family ATPase n=1 Tax=Clostridium sp. Ade.TY TaxID=1391647 RepID=UPI00041A3C88|nr:AAA family ATPase [Clostridium sp. Ade.TY]
MQIRLVNLELHNFKGIKELKVEFGKVTSIKGDNGLGKTTIMDAFNWLLFDKDSKDRKNFEIKTLGEDGQALHGLEHSVIAVLEIDGNNITLGKVYKEKWTKKRGMATKEFTGHETLYSINEIPVKKKEYEEKIKEILIEKIFKLVTNPTYFPSLGWKEQREIIQEIIGDINDDSVINYNDSLIALKGKYEDSVDNYRTRTKATIKKLNEQIKQIPYRIDECNNSIVDEDFKALEIQKGNLEREITAIDDQLEDNGKGNQVLIEHKQHLFDLRQEYQEKLNHAKLVARNPLNRLEKELQDCKNKVREFNYEIDSKEREQRNLENNIRDIAKLIKNYEIKVAELRTEYTQIDNEVFKLDSRATVCPTCNRELENSEEIVKDLKEKFNLRKAKNKEDIVSKGNLFNERIKENENSIGEIKAKLWDIKHDLEELNSNKLVAEQEAKNIEDKINNFKLDDNLDFEGKEQLEREIKATEEDISNFKLESNFELKENKRKLQCDLEQVNKLLVAKDNNKKLKERIKDLGEEERDLSNKVAELEGQLFLCEEFVRTKVELSEGLINKKFKTLKFKLFNELINGGLEETCEILVEGVPYSNANTASQINAGLEVINTLSNHYNVIAPIFIDNREAVNEIIKTDNQIINLIVSNDKELKVEVEE